MARTPTIPQLQAYIAALEGQLAEAANEIIALRKQLRHDSVSMDEYRRVQALLRTTQVKLAEARRIERPVSERRAAMLAAREAAMREGRTVTVARHV